jgi:hypothetical protein
MQQHKECGSMGAFRKAVCISVASAIALTGCATQKPPESTYIGPARYAHLDCDQLNAEAQRLLTKYAELGGQLAQDANAEKGLLPLQVVSQIVWPLALLWLPFIPALMQSREERDRRFIEGYRLMAECDAILQVAAKKGCPGAAQDPQRGESGGELSPQKPPDEAATIPGDSK